MFTASRPASIRPGICQVTLTTNGILLGEQLPGLMEAGLDLSLIHIFNMETGEILAKASSGNGQIRFGADVINRIIEQQKPGGKKKLQDACLLYTSRCV